MSLQNQRILYNNGITETDISYFMNDFRSSSVTLPLAVGHYIYIGSDLPFNHRHFEMTTPNATTAIIAVSIWFARAWVPVVDLIDMTAASGKTLAASGIIEWKTNREKGWDREQDSDDVTGITAPAIYNMYWTRLAVNATITAGTSIKYIGHKFATDAILYTYYPDLNNTALKTAWTAGKTDWNDQHFMAAEHIVRDLRARNIIFSASQILDYRMLESAASHKVAEIIYAGMGKAYAEDKNKAAEAYKHAINVKVFRQDQNANANIDDSERIISTGYATR